MTIELDRTMIRLLITSVLLFVLALSAAPADAARVSPMIVELEPVGRSSVARVELTNDADRDIPYEVRMMIGNISEEGKLSLTPADEDFLVFPAQSIVEANSQQVFRIQYVGEPELAQSEVYYMSIQQIPVDFEGDGSEVQVVVNYNVLVNVVPDGTEPKADIEDIEVTTQDGVPGFKLRVTNTGTRFFLAGMADWQIQATAEDGSEVDLKFENDEMTRKIGVGVIGPSKSRIFFVPTEKALAQDSVRVSVEP